jgi:hypothetical protein
MGYHLETSCETSSSRSQYDVFENEMSFNLPLVAEEDYDEGAEDSQE